VSANLRVFKTTTELSTEAGGLITNLSAKAIEARGRFTVALSGGSMPKLLAAALTDEPAYSRIAWAAWHVFWVDERVVPLDHPASNYRAARVSLFQHLPIPASQIYALDPSLKATAAAAAYEEQLGHLFRPGPDELPRFDLILLGMGEDGHTASLFPNHILLNETKKWVAPIFDSPKPPPERITLTFPIINNARHVLFMATGEGKAEILPHIFTLADPTNPLPAARVQPRNGRLYWFVDQTAAKVLQSGD